MGNKFLKDMKSCFLLGYSLIFMAMACQTNTSPQQVSPQVGVLQSKIDSLQSLLQTPKDDAPLVHVVLLNIKDDLTLPQRKNLYEAILHLKNIEVVHHLVLGDFIDLKDQRALSEYEIVFQVQFKNQKDYLNYQKHPYHVALKSLAKDMLSAPPTTYDYVKK